VSLSGDKALVAEVAPILQGRGIATAGADCPALDVSLEKRGKVTLVSQAPAGDRAESREVTDVRTAATVIESWVRTDLEAPLLVHRPLADVEAPDRIVAKPEAERPPRLQIFTHAETSFANDRTAWVGFEAGACSMFGRACLGGRLRVSTVADGPNEWDDVMDREAVDALFGFDVPLRFGAVGVSPGTALGLGWIHTHEDQPPPDSKQTLGLRAQAHLALSYAVSRRFALESIFALALGQRIATSTSTPERLPDDPRLLAHVGLGVRFEGP
jgi:hypothetical protein